MDNPAVQQRVKELAKTLRSTGIAASETRAEEMARDIVRTEVRQQEMLDKKRDDPSLNPQQRAKNMPKQSYSIDENISQEKPISELLAEDVKQENTSALKRPESFSVEQSGSVPEVEETPPVGAARKETQAPVAQRSTTQPAQPTQQDAKSSAPEPKKPTQPAGIQTNHSTQSTPPTTPPGQPAQPAPALSGDNSAQKAFGMMVHNANQQQAKKQEATTPVQPEKQSAPEPQPIQEDKPTPDRKQEKSAEAKVDLSEMFNFSKR